MRSRVAATGGILGRLRRDTRGNALAIMAAAMIPLAALAGSAIDMARLYVVKSRMQQACDAGVLAGRKFMTDSTSATLDTNASTQAQTFFANNLRIGWMGTIKSPTAAPFTPTKTTDNRVSGVATVVVPMTIMKMFGAPNITLNVVCEARYDVADTDVLFVLDTTGSMACLPSDSDSACSTYVGSAGNNSYARPVKQPADSVSGYAGLDQTAGYAGTTGYAVPEKSGSRIAALRKAVVDFYTTMASNVQSTTHVRYGFVTYSSSVNVGAAVQAKSTSYMLGGPGAASSWTYQSRKVTADNKEGNPVLTTDNTAVGSCPTAANPTVTRTPAATTSQPFTYNSSTQRASVATRYWDTGTKKCTTSTQSMSAVWTYQAYPLDVASYVGGATITDPTEINGSTSAWLGCIEERVTTPGVMTFSTSSLPADLNPDLVPTNDDTRWRPLWPDVEYQRFTVKRNQYTYTTNSINVNDNGGDTNLWENMNSQTKQKGGWVACGKPVQRLTTMTKAQVQAYVGAADFVPLGGTYHDVGMIWGTRMLSSSGIFAADNAAWPGRGDTNKVLIFLTDGDMSPSPYSYGLYGMEYYDNRVTDGDLTDQKDYHNARLLAECAKAQDMQIDVWTVSIAPSSTAEMTKCATTSDQALFTTSGDDLSAAFVRIAKQVARLRLSK